MKIDSQSQVHVTLLIPHGPLVTDEEAAFRRAVSDALAPKTKRVVLDMADVPYLDSHGIELLLELCSVRLPPHQRPKLAALSETCMEALELTDTLPRLEVFDTVENALRSCQN
jgi:anti-anti-sigma factor